MTKKPGFIFIIKTILFMTASVYVFDLIVLFVPVVLGIVPMFIMEFIRNYLSRLYETLDQFGYGKYTIIGFEFAMHTLAHLFSPLTCWLYAKIFGLFKELDKLRLPYLLKYTSLTIIALLTFLILLLSLPDNSRIMDGLDCFAILALPVSYFLYTVANKLTPKYKLLQKIGYICSLRFVKDTFKKAREKFCHGKKN